jgi:hypothetical protein
MKTKNWFRRLAGAACAAIVLSGTTTLAGNATIQGMVFCDGQANIGGKGGWPRPR